MATGNDSSERETSKISETSERQETLEIDDETDTPRRLNTNREEPVSPESGIVLDTNGTNMTAQTENTAVSERKEVTDGLTTDRYVTPNEMFTFDLTNPDEVMQLLETVDLTDEDTEVLLNEAYSVNRKLKEMLRQKESGDTNNQTTLSNGEAVIVVPGKSFGPGQRGSSSTNSSGKRSTGSGIKRQSRGGSSNSNARGDKVDTFTKNAPLPPIKDTLSPGQPTSSQQRIPSAIYSAKLRRPAPSAGERPTRNVLSSQGPANHQHIPRPGLMVNKCSVISN